MSALAPQVVAFDLMDTLLTDPFREALEAGFGLPFDELRRRRGAGWSAWPAFERGEISEQEYWACHEGAGLELDLEGFHAARRGGYAWLDGMQQLLRDLEGQVQRIIASNYPVWIEELARRFLDGHIEALHASCHLGVRKPEPAFFERLLEHVDVSPDAVLFVDDRQDNVEAARGVGLRAHLFTGVHDLRQRLRDEGLRV